MVVKIRIASMQHLAEACIP